MTSEPSAEFYKIEQSLLDTLAGHPLKGLAETLGLYLKTGCDLASFLTMTFVSAAKLGQPFSLELISERAGIDVLMADRIFSLTAESIARPRTVKEVHKLVDQKFEGTEVVFIPRNDKNLFGHACELSLRDTGSGKALPGVITITDRRSSVYPFGPTLSINTSETPRLLRGIGHLYSTPDQTGTQAAGKKIQKLLDRINPAEQPDCPFEASVSASIRAEELLIFQRFLRTITTQRVQWCRLEGIELSEKERTCSLEDYTLAKTFLGQLPLCGLDSSLSPYALSSAYTLFERIQANGAYSKTIAGQSKFGNKAFDRAVAKDVLGICYNTTKKHLQQLEDEGIVETTVLCSKRKRGQHIFFRFKRGRDPPFVSQNPFELLPDPHEIA